MFVLLNIESIMSTQFIFNFYFS